MTNSLHHRATALVFAVVVTVATLTGLDFLAQPDAAGVLAQAVAAASRG